MKFLRVFAVVTALLVSSSVDASTISFRVTEGGELSVVFGLVPFEVSGELQGNPLLFSGSADLVSGPLVSLDVDSVNGLTTYAYGAGLLKLVMELGDGSVFVNGNFMAETLPFSFVVCEGCDALHGGGNAPDFEIPLGLGLLDADLADFLHVDPHTLGGSIKFGLEDIRGDPLSNARLGFDHAGFAVLEIEARDVPEPALLLTLSVGAAAIFGRRGISRARTSGRR